MHNKRQYMFFDNNSLQKNENLKRYMFIIIKQRKEKYLQIKSDCWSTTKSFTS